MLYPEEIKILESFRLSPNSWLTIKEIMKRSEKRSYNWAYLAIQRLCKERVLKSEKVGNTWRYTININSQKAIFALTLAEQSMAETRFPNRLTQDLIQKLTQHTQFFCLVIGGSYASGTQRRDSDIDLVLIVPDDSSKKEIKPYLVYAEELEGYEFHNQIFTKDEFRQMLKDKGENFGKELVRKHIVLYGVDTYYAMLREAMPYDI